MNTGRFPTPGKTRICPHCKATILESAAVCPGCHHHLRFDPAAVGQRLPALTPLKVEGKISPPIDGPPWEYSVVLAIRNGRGEEIARQVVGVGALQPTEERTFSLAVEAFTPAELTESKPALPSAPAARPADPRAVAAAMRTLDPRAPVPGARTVDPRAASPGRPTPPSAPPAPLPATRDPRDPRAPLRPVALKDPRVFARETKPTPKGT